MAGMMPKKQGELEGFFIRLRDSRNVEEEPGNQTNTARNRTTENCGSGDGTESPLGNLISLNEVDDEVGHLQ
jgi:hypothetical protein